MLLVGSRSKSVLLGLDFDPWLAMPFLCPSNIACMLPQKSVRVLTGAAACVGTLAGCSWPLGATCGGACALDAEVCWPGWTASLLYLMSSSVRSSLRLETAPASRSHRPCVRARPSSASSTPFMHWGMQSWTSCSLLLPIAVVLVSRRRAPSCGLRSWRSWRHAASTAPRRSPWTSPGPDAFLQAARRHIILQFVRGSSASRGLPSGLFHGCGGTCRVTWFRVGKGRRPPLTPRGFCLPSRSGL